MDREVIFRGKTNNGKWLYGDLIHNRGKVYIAPVDVLYQEANPEDFLINEETVGEFTGLKDRENKKIYEGDILKFDDDNGIWTCPVIIERGTACLNVYEVKQIENPKDWDKPYPKTESRSWGIRWGYEEDGPAYTSKSPLARATIFRGKAEELQNSDYYKRGEKYGWDSFYVEAVIVGNIWENPELYKLKED